MCFAIEAIHTYSLIHDDLPAMDNDEERRGKPCNHKIYGEATAILAGNALQVLAYEVLALYSLSPQSLVLFSQAIGGSGLLGGQFLDIEQTKPFRNKEKEIISEEFLQKILKLKTAKLFEISVLFPFIEMKVALKANTYSTLFSLPITTLHTYQNNLEKITNWGLQIGELFQLVDDYDDWQDEKKDNSSLNILSIIDVSTLKNKIKTLGDHLYEEAKMYFENSFFLQYLPIYLANSINKK